MDPKWITPSVVAIVAGISVWLLSEQAPEKPQPTASNNTIPDSYMENFTTYVMDKDGNLRHEMRASYMEHFSSSDHSNFVAPEFIFHRSDNSKWTMSADKGTAKNGTEEITFLGKVIITREQLDKDDTTLTIHTDELLVRPDDSYVETDKLITITSGKHSIKSTGIRAYIKKGRLELLSRVRGVYAL